MARSQTMSLFDDPDPEPGTEAENLDAPLAERMRPRSLDEFVGQSHLVGPGRMIRRLIEDGGAFPSLIFWGGPGTGKTTLARMLSGKAGARFVPLSAVLSGVKELREAIAEARDARRKGLKTILFVDEIHRFNKSQQDALLPAVEDGAVSLIGATTENPSFEVNNALLSRARVYLLKSLDETDLGALLDRALGDPRGLRDAALRLEPAARELLIAAADGDARRMLNLLETAADLATTVAGERVLSGEAMRGAIGSTYLRFDKGGENFYDQISALHKAVRGSDPDAALYWLCRMFAGGCDPLYVARRALRMASEDIGNADPRALTVALEACAVYERLGSPEGELAIAQAIVFMACAAKSNAVYVAYQAATEDAKRFGSLGVPLHLRNAPTRLMKEIGYGKGYRYAHDEPDAYAAGERYLPEGMPERRYYVPAPRGLEIKIAEALEARRSRDRTPRGG